MFDRYTSLGNNCEIAFQFRRVLGTDSSSFFSWNVTSLKSLISLLQNDFDGIFHLENLTNYPEKGLLHDSSHDFYVHSPFQETNIADEDDFPKNIEVLRSKFQHLANKFRQAGVDGISTVYFLKTEETADIKIRINRVSDLLALFHGGAPYKLVVIRSLDKKDSNEDTETVAYRYLKRTAPWVDATDGHVQSWDRIFREFPSTAGLRLAGF